MGVAVFPKILFKKQVTGYIWPVVRHLLTCVLEYSLDVPVNTTCII